jgi:succinate-acetate transporter protein
MTATWTWIKLLLLSLCNWTNQRSFVRFGAVEGTISCCSAGYCTGNTVTPAPFVERFPWFHYVIRSIF